MKRILLLLSTVFACHLAGAQDTTYSVLFDTDNDPATGCVVTASGGPIAGIEQVLNADASLGASPQVDALNRQVCSSGSLGAPQVVASPAPYPIGLNNGTDGSDVVELAMAASNLPAGTDIRVYFISDSAEGGDAVLTDDTGAPVLISLAVEPPPPQPPTGGDAVPVPSLSVLALFLLLGLMLWVGARAARRHAFIRYSLLGLLLVSSLAWAAHIMLDGNVGDWAGIPPAATDPAGDSDGGSATDIIAVFASLTDDDAAFRMDIAEVENQAPTANDDAFTTDEDTSLTTGSVLANDSDPDGDTLGVQDFDATGTTGSLTSNGDGTFEYDPDGQFEALGAGETDTDSFSYTVTDGTLTDTATVTITVNGVNDAPEALADSFATEEDTQLLVPAPGVLQNDTDVEGDALTAVLDTDVSDGTLVLNADGSFTYDPDLDFNGTDSFTYTASDGADESTVVTVTINVGPLNDGPEAVDDLYATDEDTVLNVAEPGVLLNDTDPESDPLDVTAFDATSAQGADVTVNADGSFSYDPGNATALQSLDAGDMVNDTFNYTISDGTDTDSATVTIEVTGIDDAATAADDTATVAEDSGPNTIDVLANDDDPDGGSNTVSSVTQPANGTVVITNAGADLSYEPDPNYCNDGGSPDGFTYTLSPGGDTASVAVTVTCVNDPPTASNDAFLSDDSNPGTSTDRNAIGNTTLKIGIAAGSGPERVLPGSLLDNDADPVEGDTITLVAVQGAGGNVGNSAATDQGGSVSVAADGTFTYQPPVGFTGNDTFSYTISDGSATAMAMVTIQVAEMVWYVDSSASGSADTGTSINPFVDLSDINGDNTNVDAPGDTLFLYQGNSDGTFANAYTGGIELQDNQQLIGELGGLSIDGTFLVPPGPAYADITHNSGSDAPFDAGVTLANNVYVEGIATVNTDGPGFLANNVGGFSVTSPLVRSTAPGSTGSDGIKLNGINAPATFGGQPSILNAAAQGLVINGSSAALFFGDLSVQNSLGAGIQLGQTFANTGAITFGAGSDVSGSGGPGLIVRKGDADVFYGGTIGANGSNGFSAVVIGGRTGGTVTVAGDITDTGGGIDIGPVLANSGGTFVFNGMLDLDTGADTAITINSSSATETRFNGGLDIDTTTGAGISTNSGGTLSFGGSNSIATTTGTAVSLVNTLIGASGFTLDTVSVNGAADGIRLTNAGAGSFTASTGNLANVTSRGVDISGGSGDVTINAPISTTSTGRSVEVTTHTGGTVDFNGFIDDNGLGIRAENNFGAVLRFDGGMDIDTAGGVTEEGFQATGGGTVHVTGINDVNTSVGTGTAVNIANTTIGSDDVTFRNVSANGSANGIILNNTGSSGGFEVTGMGSTDESGGVIDDTTGDAVVLVNVDDVTLRNMRLGEATTAQGDMPDSNTAINGDAIDISNSANLTFSNLRISDTSGDGIKGSGVTNLALSNSEIFNVGLDAGSDETAFDFGDTTGGTDNNLLGTVTITNTVFDGMQEFGIYVYNDTGSLDLEITGSRFSNQRTNNAEAGILVETDGTASMDVLVTGTTCDVLEGASCVFAQALDGVLNLVATNNTAQNGGSVSNFNNTDGFNLATGDGTLNFDISNNSIQRNRGHGVRLAANFGGTLNGQVTGNDIDGDGPFPPAASAQPILLQIDGGGAGNPSAFVLIDNNDIDDVVDTILELIDIEARDGVTNLDVIVTNNRLNQDAGATLGDGDHGIEIRARDSASVRATVSSNTVTSPDASINLDVEDSSSMEATVIGNTLSSSGDDEFQANTEDAGTSLCLDLRGHTSGVFDLDEDAGTFTIENFITLATDNLGAVVDVGVGITADGGTCIEPTAPTIPSP